MKTKTLPLEELSIAKIYNGENATYEVPIYQRNYAWENDEITTLILDVYDAFAPSNRKVCSDCPSAIQGVNNACSHSKQAYYIGTLVSFHKGDQVYEVIDGQQRLTTIYLVLGALGVSPRNKLTYRARKKSEKTIQSIKDNTRVEIDEKDEGIANGFKYAVDAIKNRVPEKCLSRFKSYFLDNVRLIHYQVPKDIDLNHYFEIMNSRGEQLEKHEIIKARLIEKLGDEDKKKFNHLWECCSEMNVYIQQKYGKGSVAIFGEDLTGWVDKGFDSLPPTDCSTKKWTIEDLIDPNVASNQDGKDDKDDKIDTFQPIIDFSNFLLVVLKLTRMEDYKFHHEEFSLVDMDLIKEFVKLEDDGVVVDDVFVKKFGFNLLKAKYLLDNYIVHHSNEEDTDKSNPWKLQRYCKDDSKPRNLTDNKAIQNKLVQLLSMFEVTFTAKQRKNYLFYCLLHLFNSDRDINNYCKFLSDLADKYFKDIYLDKKNLNSINTPIPGSFDSSILRNNKLDTTLYNGNIDFNKIYGDGTTISNGIIPLFIFNYLDYKLWEKYANELRGERTIEESKERTEFFDSLGCSDFGLDFFDQFYFSRTRKSLEHYYPQALAGKDDEPTQEQINCLGNYAMIGSEANSSGSNWTPKAKLVHYLDASRKINPVSVASIKFRIMMQKCKDNHDSKVRKAGDEWNFEDIKTHQNKMLEVLLAKMGVTD